jgi:hypothetical protein
LIDDLASGVSNDERDRLRFPSSEPTAASNDARNLKVGCELWWRDSSYSSNLTGLGADTENRFFRWGWRTPQRTKNAADAVSGLSDPLADRAVLGVRHVGKRPEARHRGKIRVPPRPSATEAVVPADAAQQRSGSRQRKWFIRVSHS